MLVLFGQCHPKFSLSSESELQIDLMIAALGIRLSVRVAAGVAVVSPSVPAENEDWRREPVCKCPCHVVLYMRSVPVI